MIIDPSGSGCYQQGLLLRNLGTAPSSGSVTVCVSQNKDLATDEWCTKLCKANVTQSAEAQAAEPSECDPDYCTCFDPEESREAQVKQVRQMERAQPSGLPECPYLAPGGCSASKPYECVAGPSAGQCSELNWFDRTKECELSCLHTKLLMFAPHSDTDEWIAGPVAPRVTTFRQQVPHYSHDPKKLTMGARGIEVRRLNVMLTPGYSVSFAIAGIGALTITAATLLETRPCPRTPAKN